MSKSKQEEIIGVLWIIAGTLCLHYSSFGWVLVFKGILDNILSVVLAFKEE